MKAVWMIQVGNMPYPSVVSHIEAQQRKFVPGWDVDVYDLHHCVTVYDLDEPGVILKTGANRDAYAIEAQPPRVRAVTWGEYVAMLLEWHGKKKGWRTGRPRWWYKRPHPLYFHVFECMMEDERHDHMKSIANRQLGKPYRMISKYFGWGKHGQTEWGQWAQDPVWHCSHFQAFQLQYGMFYDYRDFIPRIERQGMITPSHNFAVLKSGLADIPLLSSQGLEWNHLGRFVFDGSGLIIRKAAEKVRGRLHPMQALHQTMEKLRESF